MPYFDHNATSPLLPEAREALVSALDEAWQNPSSPYRDSAQVHRLLEESRQRIAGFLGADPSEIVFTGGATEANNAAIAWAARHLPSERAALVAPTEHPSVLAAARSCFGNRLVEAPMEPSGRVDAAALPDAMAASRVGFVATMAANNETGVLSDLQAVHDACRKAGALLLCDAAQWIGRLPGRDLPGGSFLVGCAHKFGGPKGTAFIRVPRLADGFRGALGGEQESGRRAGTENYPAIAAMTAALVFAESQDGREREMWRDEFIASVLEAVPGACVNGGNAPRLWNTVSLCLPAHENTRWVMRLDKAGFQVSTGSACATGSHAPSHVLAAMGLTPEEARRTIRVSSGWATTRDDWQRLASAIADLYDSEW